MAPHFVSVGGVLPLRADAARNREAIVEAARAVFAEHGLDAPLDEIAKRAVLGTNSPTQAAAT
jgi:AcrR family transcriptional regulator